MPTKRLLCLRRAANKINTSGPIFWGSRLVGVGVFLLYVLLQAAHFKQLYQSVENGLSVGRAYLQAFAPILTSGGIIGAILTWLLQTIHDTECGVEIGVIYRRKYPYYPANLICLALSTGICAFCMLSKPINGAWMLCILIANGVGLCTELVYIISMTWNFLLRQSVRKMNSYKYLQTCVQTAWNDSCQLRWETFELVCLIKDFPYASSWYYNCPTGWLFNRWTARYRALAGQADRVLMVNETAALVERIIAAVPEPQVASDVLGSFIYNCYLVDRAIAPPRQDRHRGVLPPSVCERRDRLMERYGMLDEVDRQYSYISAEEKETALALFISAWAACMFDNDRLNNVLPGSDGAGIHERTSLCMGIISDAIVHANCLHRKRMRDPNRWTSNLSFASDEAIKNLNGFVLFVWSATLCFFLNDIRPYSPRNTSYIFSCEKEVADLLARSGLTDPRSQEYSVMTFGWLNSLVRYRRRNVRDWLAELKETVDILCGRPAMSYTRSADEQIEEAYACRRMMGLGGKEDETEREKETVTL